MKKWSIIAVSVLAVLGCTKDRPFTEPCTFDLKVTKVAGTKAWLNIAPSNSGAYYSIALFNEYSDVFDKPAMELAEMQLGWDKDRYGAWENHLENMSSYADVFCYQGTREIKLKDLVSGLRHRIVIMQVNPETRTIIGTPQDVGFATKVVGMTDLTFDVQFGADKVTITPSDPDATYYWDYDSRSRIEEKFMDPGVFFYSIIDLYEDYDFMSSMISRGTEAYVFSANDRHIEEGEECILVVAGYADGEINTAQNAYSFVYHKDKPIEYTLIDNDNNI